MESPKPQNLIPSKSKIESSSDLSQTLDFLLKQLDNHLKNYTEDNYPDDQLFQTLREHLQNCLTNKPIIFGLKELEKMTAFCEKYSLSTLYPLLAPHGFYPINFISIKIITELTKILIDGSFLMLKKFVIDQRFSGLDEFETTMLQQHLTIRKNILNTVMNHANHIAKIRFVMAYHLLQISKYGFNEESSHAKLDKRSTDEIMNHYQSIQSTLLSDPIDSILDDLIGYLNFSQLPIIKINELEKTKASGIYLQEIILKKLKSSKINQNIFDFEKIRNILEEIASTKNISPQKKKKNSTQDSSWEQKWHTKCDNLVLNIAAPSNQTYELQNQISITIKKTVSLLVQNKTLETLEAYQQAMNHTKPFMNDFRNQIRNNQGHLIGPMLEWHATIIEVGLDCLDILQQKHQDESALKPNPLHQLSAYFCSIDFFSTTTNSPQETYEQTRKNFFTIIIDAIKTKSRIHLLIAESLITVKTFDPQVESKVNLVEKYLQQVLEFHDRIMPEIVYQNDEVAQNNLKEINDTKSYLESRLKGVDTQIHKYDLHKYDLLEHTCNEFKQNYTEKLVDATQNNPNQLALKTALNQAQQTFKQQLPNYFSTETFKTWFTEQAKNIEKRLIDCFQSDDLTFTKKQYDQTGEFIHQFSFFYLYELCPDKKKGFIHEESINVVGGLIEILINASYEFISKLKIQEILYGRLGVDIDSNIGFKQVLLQSIAHCVLYASRTHLLFSQALLDPAVDHDSWSAIEAQHHLDKSKKIQKKFFEVVAKNSYLARALGYHFSLLKEIELSLQVKDECDLIMQIATRKQNFPNESKYDSSLTPTYGYQELNAYLEWLHDHKTLKKKPRKKPKKKNKTNDQETPIIIEELSQVIEQPLTQIDPLAELFRSDRQPNFKKTNPVLTRIFNELDSIINQSNCSGFVFMYGSAVFKNNPDDFDLCILNIDIETEYTTKIKPLIDRFIQLGAVDKKIPKNGDKYGYEENGRYTIPIPWATTTVEITLSKEKTFADFARKNLDYSVCAFCYDFKQQQVFTLTENSWDDIDKRQLNTVDDPQKIFMADPARILRGIRLIALENFHFSVACIQALNALFDGEKNLFNSENITPKILIRHTRRLFDKQCIKSLHDLGLFSKLQATIKDIDHENAQDCYNKLETYMACG